MGSLNPLLKKKDTTETNQYAIRKGTAHRLMDVALLMANISQLKMILDSGSEGHNYFYLLLVLIAMSLLCQFIFAMLIVISWSSKEADDSEAKSSFGVAGLIEEMESLREDEEKKELADKTEETGNATMMEEVIVAIGEDDSEPLHKPSEEEKEKKDKGKNDDKNDINVKEELFEIAAETSNRKAMERLEKLLALAKYNNRPKRRFTISLRTAEFLDRLTVFLVFMIIIINMFITGFGLQASPAAAGAAPVTPSVAEPTQ